MIELSKKYPPHKQMFLAIGPEGQPVIVDQNGKIRGPYLGDGWPVDLKLKWSLMYPEDDKRLSWDEIIRN